MTQPPQTLDDRVAAAADALRRAGVGAPDVLLFPATGLGGLADGLDEAARVELGEFEGAPGTFAGAALIAGRAADTEVWIVADAPGEAAGGVAPWVEAFPIWLAAACGARAVVHLSAGTSLGAAPAGSIVRLTDHINLSGSSPLVGIGESRLGPLFPDQSRVHDAELGALADAASAHANESITPAVAACTLGPALSTPAELASYRTIGADVAVQRLATPLVASAHAGLTVLSLVAITDGGDEPLDVAKLVARTQELAPRLDAIALEVARRAGPLVRRRREEAAE